MIAVLCSIFSGVTIVLSRQINGYFTKNTSASTSTFMNYFTGLVSSIIIFIFYGISLTPHMRIETFTTNPMILFGGAISVINVFILNILVLRVPPVALTLTTFITQILSGMLFDYLFYGLFSPRKLLGICIVIAGLIISQMPAKKPMYSTMTPKKSKTKELCY